MAREPYQIPVGFPGWRGLAMGGGGWEVGSGLGIHIDWCINNDKGYQFATEKFPYVAVFLLVS